MARITKAAALLFSLLLFLSIQPVHADERSYRIGSVDIHARVDGAGDMHVTEEDTYHFDGVFNGIIVQLDSSGSDGIEDFQAYEVTGQQQIPLRSERSGDGPALEYRVFRSSEDESATFRFTYTVRNVVQVYADTAELYWKFFDDRNQNTLEQVDIEIELPGGIELEAIRAFGHGPNEGIVQVEDNGITRYQISPLHPGELLEARLLFPGSHVPESTRVSDVAMLEAILEEERNWQAEDDAYNPLYEILILLALNVMFGVYIKFIRNPRPDWRGKYYRELPSELTPAVVGYLRNYRVGPELLVATLADLVRKQRIRMEKTTGEAAGEVDYTFRLLNRKGDGKNGKPLQPHESLLIRWFFDDIGKNDQVTLSGIRAYAESPAKASMFYKRWWKWQEEIERIITRLDYVVDQQRLWNIAVVVIIVQLIGFWWLGGLDLAWHLLCPLALLIFLPRTSRRTKAGQTEYAKWDAFRRFLRDYSRIASREPMAVYLWEHYFVYAIPLGQAKKMVELTEINLPQTQLGSIVDFANYSFWTSTFDESIHLAHKNSPSSRGSDNDGGWFSSGGGDGGGGGGRGAF